MDDMHFQPFAGSVTAIGTYGLRSCSVVIVASRSGALMAHIGPHGEDWTTKMMRDFADTYRKLKAAHFGSERHPWVITAHMYDGTIYSDPLPYLTEIIYRGLMAMGLENYADESYKFKVRLAHESPQFSGKGTVFVDGADSTVNIYVEDRLVQSSLNADPLNIAHSTSAGISGRTANETVAVRWEFRIEDLVTEDPTVASLALVISRICKFEPDFVAKHAAAGDLLSPMIKKIKVAIDTAIMQTSVLELAFLQRLNCIRHMFERAEDRLAQTISDAHLQAARSAVAELLDIFKWTRDDPDFEVPDLPIELAYLNAIGYGAGREWETRMFTYIPGTPSADTTLATLTAGLTLCI
ncbi:MAG: hypothetical protein Q9207_003247 [Kuettlingeria erythrocarpa]